VLLHFKKEQRDMLNREKLEVVIAAALEGPQALDAMLAKLCASRALDDGLVDYLDAVASQARAPHEAARVGEPVRFRPRVQWLRS
jgi:hypothetical protein